MFSLLLPFRSVLLFNVPKKTNVGTAWLFRPLWESGSFFVLFFFFQCEFLTSKYLRQVKTFFFFIAISGKPFPNFVMHGEVHRSFFCFFSVILSLLVWRTLMLRRSWQGLRKHLRRSFSSSFLSVLVLNILTYWQPKELSFSSLKTVVHLV